MLFPLILGFPFLPFGVSIVSGWIRWTFCLLLFCFTRGVFLLSMLLFSWPGVLSVVLPTPLVCSPSVAFPDLGSGVYDVL